MTSDSDVEHPADSFQGLPDAHATVKHLTPKSKVTVPRDYLFALPMLAFEPNLV